MTPRAFADLMLAWEVVAWLIVAIGAILAIGGLVPDLLLQLRLPLEMQLVRLVLLAVLLPPIAYRFYTTLRRASR